MITPLEITKDELVSAPEMRQLATGKNITAFNLRISPSTVNLISGQKLFYQDALYEVMNKQSVQSNPNYLKVNCFLKVMDKAA